MLEKKHIAGIGVSVMIFGSFGLMLGAIAAAFTGVALEDPIDRLATGPTPIPIADITTPFGLSPQDIGLAADAAFVLPGIPVTVEIAGITLSVSEYPLADISGYGGVVFGFLIGLYYAIDIAWSQRKNEDDNEDEFSP